jgi:predicted RNA-binding protein associated with RNAse of E/G family
VVFVTIVRIFFLVVLNILKILKITQRGQQKTTKNWGTYDGLLVLSNRRALKHCAAVLIIDESVRRRLGKLHMHELVNKLQDEEMNWYLDIIPTATSDDDIIRIVDSYLDTPVLLLTSDKELYERLPGKAVFIKSKGNSNGVRIICNIVKRRITRL